MTSLCKELLDHVVELEETCLRFPYPRRVQIERGIFGTCKALAQAYFGYNLQGFTVTARDEIEGLPHNNAGCEDAFRAIRLAFELRAVLGNLASGDPYLDWELAGPSLPGRDDAIRLFSKQLQEYATSAASLLPESADS